jgi:hypothetical protein
VFNPAENYSWRCLPIDDQSDEYRDGTQPGGKDHHAPEFDPFRFRDHIEKIMHADISVQKRENTDGDLPGTKRIHRESQAACWHRNQDGRDKLAGTESSPSAE